MFPTVTLFALALLACEPDTDGGADDSADTADTAVDDTGPVDPGCVIERNSPRTTSWHGGETITLTLDCDDPAAAESLEVEVAGQRVAGKLGEIDGRTLTASYTVPEAEREGIEAVLLFFGKVEVDGGDQHFRLDPAELDLRVETDGSVDDWGLGGTLESVAHSWSGNRMMRSRLSKVQGSAQILARVYTEPDLGPLSSYDVIEISGDAVDYTPYTDGNLWLHNTAYLDFYRSHFNQSDAGTAVHVNLATHDGKTLRGQDLVLSYATLGLATLKDDELADKAPRVWTVNVRRDDSWTLEGVDVIVSGVSAKDGSPVLVSATYGPSGKTSDGWKVNWSGSLIEDMVSVTGDVHGSDGTPGVIQVRRAQPNVRFLPLYGDGTGGEWRSFAKGTDEDAVLYVTSAVRESERGQDVVLAMLDDTGAVTLGEVPLDGGDIIETQVVGSGESTALANFRRLEPGDRLFFPPIELRTDDQGGTQLISSYVWNTSYNNRGFGYRYDDGTTRPGASFVAVWDGAISVVPDHMELRSTGGQTVVSGSGGTPTPGAPELYNQLGGHTLGLGPTDIEGRHGKYNGNVQAHTAGTGDWMVFTRGAEVIVETPDGDELPEALPLDPSSEFFTQVIDGQLVIFGQVMTQDADGATTVGPGVIAADRRWKAGMSVALFNMLELEMKGAKAPTLDAITSAAAFALERGDPGSDLRFTGQITATGDDGETVYGTVFGGLDLADLPGDGEETVIDLDLQVWPVLSEEPAAPLTPLWLQDGLVAVGDHTDAPLGETDGVTSLGKLTGHTYKGDLVVTLAHGGKACTLATWLVSPGKEGDLDLDAAILLSEGKQPDCSDLAVAEGVADLDGTGRSTVLMSQASGDDDTRELYEVVWDGEQLLQLPSLTLPAWDDLGVGDLDGDHFDDVLLHVSSAADEDGTVDTSLSGLLLRSRGRHLAQEIRAEVVGIKNASKVAEDLPDDTAVIAGAELRLEGSDLDVLVIGGTAGKRLVSFKTNQQLSYMHIRAYGTLLE